MLLVVGLGNPGKKYADTRHNVGFMIADAIASANSSFSFRDKFKAEFAKGDDLSLLKPQTFMNLSGESVQPAAAFLKVGLGEIVVVHDELDIPFGEVRLKVGGGHAGHNGLRSIIDCLGNPGFVRVRVGIGRPPPGFQGDVADYVLSGFSSVEKPELSDLVARGVSAVRAIADKGLTKAMESVNQRPKAPAKTT